MKSLYLIFVVVIFAIGLVMIFSTSSAEILDHDLKSSPYQALRKQMFFATLGGIFSFGVWRLGYRQLLQWSPLLLLVFSFFLLLVLMPGIGREANGSRRWIAVGGFSFQPSEFVKYLIPLYCINQLSKKRKYRETLISFMQLLALMSVPLLLILWEPNNGTVFVIGTTLVVVFFVSQVPFKYWGIPLIALAFMGGIFAWQLPYVSGRMKVYLNPGSDVQGKGHQPLQAKIAAGSGKFLGKGPGNSWQKLSYLPKAQNDYIAAIYAEEFGFLGILALIFFYTFLAFLGFYIAYHAVDTPGFCLAVVVTFLLSLQVFLNLGVVSGLLPTTGLNLPFFSQGGSSLIANLMGVGLLQSIELREKSVSGL